MNFKDMPLDRQYRFVRVIWDKLSDNNEYDFTDVHHLILELSSMPRPLDLPDYSDYIFTREYRQKIINLIRQYEKFRCRVGDLEEIAKERRWN